MENKPHKSGTFPHALLWALPYLLFMAPFVYSLAQQPFGWRTGALWIALIAFIGFYVASWIIFQVCARHLDTQLTVFIVVMLGLIFLLAVLSGVGESCYFLIYVCSVIIFLVPEKRIPTFIGVVLLEGIIIIYLFPSSTLIWAMIVVPAAVFISFLSRRSMQISIDQKLALAEIEYRSAEAERSRVSAQLHDTLGQTLTAINLYAQLTVKEIEHGHNQQASLSAENVLKLAQEGLTQVRRVVKENYTLCFKTEVENSLALLHTVNIELSTHDLDELPTDLENFSAWMLREGTSNIIHHSTARHAYLVANKRGIALINDGGEITGRRPHSGNGIKGLLARCDESMRLTCGKLNTELWHLWMGSVPPPKHGPGFIMQLTFKE